MISLDVDTSAVDSKIAEFKKSYAHNLDNNARLYGKHVAQQAFRYTLPAGKRNNYWNITKQKERIAEDNVTMYPEWTDDNWASRAYSLIESETSTTTAKRWWGEYKREEHGGSERFDPESGGFEYSGELSHNTAQQKAQRLVKSKKINDKRYQMRRSKVSPKMFKAGVVPIAMVKNKRASATKRRQKLAGLAKASWRQAAQDFGGQQTYTRGKWQVTWPKGVRVPLKAVGKKVGRGTFKTTDKAIYIRVSSRITYMDEALSVQGRGKAIRYGKQAIIHLHRLKLQHAIASSFGKQRKSRAKKAA